MCFNCCSLRTTVSSENDVSDVQFRCLACGHLEWVYQEKGAMVVQHTQTPKVQGLPRQGTKLMTVLNCLANVYPGSLKTIDLSSRLGAEYTKDSTTALLVVLEYRGLCYRVEKRVRMPGGSIWAISEYVHRELGLEK